MKLVKDWKRVIIISISFWAQVVGLIVLILPEVRYRITGVDSDPVLMWWAGVLLLIFGLIGRLVKQTENKVYEWLKILAVCLIIAGVSFLASPSAHASNKNQTFDFLNVASNLVSKWEGKRNHAYLDTIASPPVWTVCYGETRGVNQGDYYTDTECLIKLKKALLVYRAGWGEYVNQNAKQKWLPVNRQAAYTSLAYNVGISAAGNSTATRRLNAGNIEGGCIAIGWWNRAGGRVIRGLVNRRSEEVEICLSA